MSRLLLWRHGQTGWNAERRFQGQTDVDLNETGVRQAAEAAPRLAVREPKVIISSDLRRAARTAQALVDLTGLPMRLDPRLRERHFGPWQGMTATEIEERFPDDYLRWGSAAPIVNPAIETIETLTERVVAALRDASDEAGVGGTAVVVTHGGSARVGVGGLLGLPPETWHTLGVLGNCRFSELWLSPERGWRLESHNVG
jgi:broad specificity phosphatase PhoE